MYYDRNEMDDFDDEYDNDYIDKHKNIIKIVSFIIIVIILIVLLVLHYDLHKEEIHNYLVNNIQTATITDMTIDYDNKGNSEYEMKVKLDNGEDCSIIIDHGNFIKYKIGEIVSIKDKRYLVK